MAGFPTSISIADPGTELRVLRITGVAGSAAGAAVGAAGDVNGDGIADLLVTAPLTSPAGSPERAGVVHVIYGQAGGVADFNLGEVTPETGFRVIGGGFGSRLGLSVVAGVGDINLDGYGDIAFDSDGVVGGQTRFGRFVIYGGPSGRDDLQLGVDNGSDRRLGIPEGMGFRVERILLTDVAPGGDVNGDGFPDFIAGGSASGVILGQPEHPPLITIFGDLPQNVLPIAPFNAGGTIRTVSAGDINGDGLGDVVLARPEFDGNGRADSGSIEILFGKAGSMQPPDYLNIPSSLGFRVIGAAGGDVAGHSVAVLGDINGDGLGEVAIGAPGADPNGLANAGAVYVIYGRAAGLPTTTTTIDLATLSPANGFRISGPADGAEFGRQVKAAGDVNGDGRPDLLIGTATDAYVLFGRAGGFGGSDLTNLGPTEGFVIQGAGTAFQRFGFLTSDTRINAAGDLDGDGYDDLVIGLPEVLNSFTAGAGGALVIFGEATAPVFRTAGAAGGLLRGGDFNDRLTGGIGADSIEGGDGADVMVGNAGADTLRGEAGADRLLGGAGFDLAFYAGSAAGVAVSLASGIGAGGDAAGDTLVAIEGLIGSDGADSLVGSAGGNRLDGAGGDDTLVGGAGADTLAGAGGRDLASYAGSAEGVSVNLATGRGLLGDAAGDTLSGIEDLDGSAFSDSLAGSGVANHLRGGAGDDRLAGLAGADTLDGGQGQDSADYGASDGQVGVDLAAGIAVFGHAEGDALTGIENLLGSRFSDALRGDAGANRLEGRDGDDTLEGGDGADVLSGSAGADNLNGGLMNDLLGGGTGNDSLRGEDGNDRIEGGVGEDTLDGGDGIDTADYSRSDAGVLIRLAALEGLGGHATGDVLLDIENVLGSGQDDVLEGDGEANRLEGGAGADLLSGDGGNDVLLGGAGKDTLLGGSGRDRLYGGAEADIFAWAEAGDSPRTAMDTVEDFDAAAGDRLDLTAFGAVFAGTGALLRDGTASVNWRLSGAGNVVVQLDADGDGTADLALSLRGVTAVAAGDLLL